MDEIQICITNKCSINCNYCHLCKKKNKFISFDMFKKIISFAKSKKIQYVRLTGGDVFEHQQLIEFIEIIKKNKLNFILNVTIYRINKIKKIIHLFSKQDMILFSFQNLKQFSLLENIPNLIKTMGCIVFQPSWLDKLKELSFAVEKNNFLNFFFLRDTGQTNPEYFLNLNECLERISQLTKKITFSNAFPLCYVSEKNLHLCSGKWFDNGLTRIYFTEEGNMKPSAYSTIEINSIEDNLEKIKKINLPDLCKSCKILKFCGNGINVNKKYGVDPLFYPKHNKFINKLQKKIILNGNNIELTYFKNSDFFMQYPPTKFWNVENKKKIIKKIKTLKNDKLTIYIHFPFCQGYCKFCNVQKLNNNLKNQYIKKILIEIENFKDIIKNNEIESIYFGGGSPQLMGEDVEKIFEKLFSYMKKKPKEVNFELFPKNYDQTLMKSLKKFVTRISIGVQCFNDSILKEMGRLTSKKEMIEFITKVKQIGFEKINLDFIYGLYINNPNEFKSDFEEFLKLDPDHVTFQPLHYTNEMNFDKNHNLKNALILNKKGRIMLKELGFKQNSAEDFSKNDKIIYQEKMLLQKNILGIGDGAFGFINDFYYRFDKKNLFYKLNSIDKLYSELFLKLRFLKLNYKELNNKYNINFKSMFSDSIKLLLKKKYITFDKDFLIITEEGRNYVDLICNILSINNLDRKLI